MDPTTRSPRAAGEAALVLGTRHFALPAHPSEIAFDLWLAERTPPGASTLAVARPGRSPLELPQLRAAVLSPPPRRGRRRRGAAPALHAAAFVDLDGLTHRELAGSGLFGFRTERGARQHVRDGRFVAAELGLWPWAAVGGQPLARSWWADERFALALEEWALRESPGLTVRRLPPRRQLASARLPVA